MFGISIFEGPQHFVALALGLFDHSENAVEQLRSLLVRTKNPPISAIYTSQLLQPKNWQEYGLDLIRFLSQLSDLSQGSSMSSSLQRAIGEGSFLTEIRHNLTHKIKISDYLIQVSRKLVLRELREKYWEEGCGKIMGGYRVDFGRVQGCYERIYGVGLEEGKREWLSKNCRVVTAEWLKNESSNYQFKQFFPQFTSQNSSSSTIQLLQQLSSHKKAIAASILFRKFCSQNKNEQLCQTLIHIIKNEKQKQKLNFFYQNLVFTALKRLTFCHYLGLISKVIAFLPKEVLGKLADHWESKEEGLKKRMAKGSLYRKFRVEDYTVI